MQVVTKNHLADFTEKLLENDKSTKDSILEKISDGSAIGEKVITPEKTSFFVINDKGVNKANENKLKSGAIVVSNGNTSNNTVAYPNNWSYIDEYIPCTNKYVYLMAYEKSSNKFKIVCNSAAFYDENKQYISGTGNISSPIEVPTNAKYIRASWMMNFFKQLFITFSEVNTEVFTYSQYEVNPGAKINDKYVNIPKKLGELENDNEFISYGNKDIVCWGDSLTMGANVTDVHYAYPYKMSLMLTNGAKVINMGRGGDTTAKIGARSGAIPLVLNPFTMPADTTKVEVTFKDFCGEIVANTATNIGINPCTVGGVECEVTYENSKYYIARKSSGNQVNFTRPIQLIPYSSANYRDMVSVIWTGTNDRDIDKILRLQQAIISNLRTDKYLVVSLTAKTLFPDITDYNNKMAQIYGSKFVNVRDYLLEYGLEDAGISPTPQDTQDIADGEIPTSLRSDTIHFNDTSYPIIAKCIFEHGKQLGYWR